jgi:hypothetical protein
MLKSREFYGKTRENRGFQVGARILLSEQHDKRQAISFLFPSRGCRGTNPRSDGSFLALPVCTAALEYSSLRNIAGRYGSDATVFIPYLKTLTGCSAATIAMVLEMRHTISSTDSSRAPR